MSYSKLVVLALFSIVLAGCNQPKVPDPEPTDEVYGDFGNDSGADTSGTDDGTFGEGEFFDETLGDVIYFEFDSSEVRAQDRDLVAAHAMKLNDSSYGSVRLEGHADERGSREYNIGLGERRAQAVRQLLMIQGVSASQIQTVSFGEERPEALGSDESDYARNRRVVINYTN